MNVLNMISLVAIDAWVVMRLDSRQIILNFNKVFLREFGSKTTFLLGSSKAVNGG